MEKEYPYLAYWKKTGIQKPPTIPPAVILQKTEDAFRKSFRGKNKNSKLRNVLSEVLPKGTIESLDSLDEEFAVILAKEETDQITAEACKRKLNEAFIEEGKISLRAKEDFLYNHHNREYAKDDWALKTLPHKQALPIENVRRCLKNIYLELKDFIKYVGTEMDMNRRDDICIDVHDFEENVIEMIPDILKVLDKNELPLLIEQPSIRETAIKIIHRRISPWTMSDLSPRTLSDVLDKTTL